MNIDIPSAVIKVDSKYYSHKIKLIGYSDRINPPDEDIYDISIDTYDCLHKVWLIIGGYKAVLFDREKHINDLTTFKIYTSLIKYQMVSLIFDFELQKCDNFTVPKVSFKSSPLGNCNVYPCKLMGDWGRTMVANNALVYMNGYVGICGAGA